MHHHGFLYLYAFPALTVDHGTFERDLEFCSEASSDWEALGSFKFIYVYGFLNEF